MMRRILLAAGVVCALILTTAGCAAGPSGPLRSPSETTASSGPDAAAPDDEQEFCDVLRGAIPQLDLLVFVTNMENPNIGEELAAAASVYAETSPPNQLTADWHEVSAVFSVLAKAFDGVDPTEGEQLRSAQAALGEGIDEQAASASKAGERISAYAEAHCAGADEGTDGAAAISDACDLLSAQDLRRAFPADDPVAEGEDFGEGFVECVWTGRNAEVSVAVLPAASMGADYIDRMTPFSTSADFGDLADARAYQGMIGIGRVSSNGHTIVFTSGEQGVMVAVRIGAEGSQPADTGAAAELAQAVGTRL